MKAGARRLRLIMDARGIGRSGIGRYAHIVIEELMRDERFSEIHLLGNPAALEPYQASGKGRVRVSRIASDFYSPRFQVEWTIRSLGVDLSADVYFFPHYDAPVRLPSRSVVAVHDLIHFSLPNLFPAWKRVVAGYHLRRVVEQAAHVVVLSHSTRRDLIARIPSAADRTSVVPLGFESAFLGEGHPSAEALAHAESLVPFLLCVGNRKPHKNLIAAVRALAIVRRSIPAMTLVVAGGQYPGWEDVVREAERLALSDAVVDLENASDDTLHALYARCSSLLFPSLYEGLGLPVLEAFAQGAPVVASNRSSVPDLVDDAGLLVDPTSPEQIATAVLQLERDQETRERLVRRGRARCEEFDWKGAASGLADLLYAVGVANPDSLRRGWRHPVDLWPDAANQRDPETAPDAIPSRIPSK